MNPSSTGNSVEFDEIFVLGFEGSFSSCLICPTKISDDFNITEMESSFSLFNTLERYSNTGSRSKLPIAIVCEFESLQEENFLLLHNVRNHPVLRFIPFIAMNRDGLNHKLEALRLGFDDYYDVPVNTQVLKERIKFLSDFKKKIDTCSFEERESYTIAFSPIKRCFDIVLSALAILCLSPVLAMVAIAISIESPGGIVYRSRRVGAGYHVFNFYKFRSMYKDADKRLQALEHMNQYEGEGASLFKKINNDPRVTKVGWFIRKTSIDELPQLFNILKGDMSIVGNRPLPMYEAEQLTRDVWAKRFLAPAGLTGLWQVTKRGKNEMSTEERIGLDISYAENHSFWFDMKIIFKTPFAIIQEGNV